jgi:hypothetical protein
MDQRAQHRADSQQPEAPRSFLYRGQYFEEFVSGQERYRPIVSWPHDIPRLQEGAWNRRSGEGLLCSGASI